MEPLTQDEKATVKMFREISDLLPNMTDFQKQDFSLIRFIRARDNLDKAELMIRKHFQWRADKNIDNILNEKTLSLEIDFPVHICGRDKAGFPIVSANLGKWDFRGACESGQKREFVLYVQKYFELILNFFQHLTTEDKVITQAFVVLDFEHFTFRQLASKDVITMFLELLGIFEAEYPEILRAAYVINAPKVFQLLWAIVKPTLTERTLVKVNIIGSNKDTWKNELKKHIDFEDNWPAFHGGGVSTPVMYKFQYDVDVFRTQKYAVFPENEMQKVYVEAGAKHEVRFDLERGSKLAWNFKTINYDIGFRLEDEDGKEVVKYSRVDSHLILQRGEIICEKTGRYTFCWDNSFSAYTGKDVKFCIRST